MRNVTKRGDGNRLLGLMVRPGMVVLVPDEGLCASDVLVKVLVVVVEDEVVVRDREDTAHDRN